MNVHFSRQGTIRGIYLKICFHTRHLPPKFEVECTRVVGRMLLQSFGFVVNFDSGDITVPVHL